MRYSIDPNVFFSPKLLLTIFFEKIEADFGTCYACLGSGKFT